MSSVNVTAVTCLDNPAPFTNPFQFEIFYECLRPLPNDLEWKLTYVGSAEDEKYDQVLDSVLVGPVAVGTYRFIFQAEPPNWSKIPNDDLRGVTVLLLTCSYNDKEFIRIGYYVNVDYEEEEMRDEPPDQPVIPKLIRSILADKPRVTKFTIDWDDANENKENDRATKATEMSSAMQLQQSQQSQQQQQSHQQQQQQQATANEFDMDMECM